MHFLVTLVTAAISDTVGDDSFTGIITDSPDSFSKSIADSELVRHWAQRGEQVHRLVTLRTGRKEVEQSCQEYHLCVTHSEIHRLTKWFIHQGFNSLAYKNSRTFQDPQYVFPGLCCSPAMLNYRQTAVTYSYTVWQYNPSQNVHHKWQRNCSVST